MKNYIELAQVTNTNDFHPEIGRRILADILFQIIEGGEYLDAVKKNQFYGRKTDESNEVLENQAHQATYNSEEYIEPVDFAVLFPALSHDNAVKVYHGIIGSITEAVEMAQALAESLRENKPMDIANIIEETGDQQWYHASIASGLGATFEQIQQINIAKLQKRFGGKFDAYKAQQENRDLGAERKILEDGAKPCHGEVIDSMIVKASSDDIRLGLNRLEMVNNAAQRGLTIEISGPSGCGKSVAAESIKQLIPNAEVREVGVLSKNDPT